VAERDSLLVSQKSAEERRHGLLHLGDSLRDATTIAEMTRAAAMIAGQTVGAHRAAFARFDATGGYLTVEPDWTAEGTASIAGTHRMADYGKNLQAGLLQGELLIINDVLQDLRTADHALLLQQLDIRSLVNVPIRENGRTVATLIVHANQPRSWPEEELTFLRNVADRVEVGVARLEAESQQRLLNGELSHRMKNTMALVQAIASQTLRSIPDQGPVNAFSERVLAMSIAHDILLQDNWKAAKIAPIIDAVACTFADAARFDIRGPSVTLGSRATLALSLLIHELTTNALKYGALSTAAGRVQVTWDLLPGELELRLNWRETGGPSVTPPSRKGFGSKLIRLGLIGTGGVQLHYHPHGFEAAFMAPLAELHS
jgi:two-component sensor histidine kinase